VEALYYFYIIDSHHQKLIMTDTPTPAPRRPAPAPLGWAKLHTPPSPAPLQPPLFTAEIDKGGHNLDELWAQALFYIASNEAVSISVNIPKIIINAQSSTAPPLLEYCKSFKGSRWSIQRNGKTVLSGFGQAVAEPFYMG